MQFRYDKLVIEQIYVLIAEAKICLAVDRRDEVAVALDTMTALLDAHTERDA